MNTPRFSVTIPAYKHKFLKECIDSILSQTYMDFELIIVNDASPEDIGTVVSAYRDPRIRYYINEKNCGAINVVDNWNKCLEYAKGKYIICMGDDDKLMPNCLEEYSRLIVRYPDLDAFHGRVARINDDSKIIDIMPDWAEHESVYSLMRHRFLRRQQYIGDFCYRTEKLRALGGYFKLPMAWDSDDITSFMMSVPMGIANTNKVCFLYRVNAFTISNTGSNEIKLEAISQAETWLKDFIQKLSPKTFEEQEEYKMLPRLMRQSIDTERTILVYSSYQSSVFNIFKWLKSKKKFKLTNKHIIKALLQYINNKNNR